MKTFYIIGNGQRSKKQLQYLRKHKEHCCMINSAVLEDWGWRPKYWASMENSCHNEHWLRETKRWDILNPKNNDLTLLVPTWAYKKLKIREPVIHQALKQYNCHDSGFYDNHKFVRFGETASGLAYAAMVLLDYWNVVMIGIDGFRDAEYCLHWNVNQKKINDSHIRAWRRLRKFQDKSFPLVIVLNASEKTIIDSIPRIELENTERYLSGEWEIPEEPSEKWRNTH